jgi:hypothetical protein
MTKVAILPEAAESGRVTYRAIAGQQQSVGKTAGEALDALTSALPEQTSSTMVIVQHQRPDEFFSVQQQARLKELMLRWHGARDGGPALNSAEQRELDSLVEAETYAAGQRATALLKELEE